jgi:hypothetical protein
MATWIGHLRIAEHLLAVIDNLDPEYFALGSLAPDSGFPDENWEKFDPPTEITHFKRRKSVEGTAIQELAFYRKYEEELAPGYADQRQRSFLLAYFFHLVADHIWAIHVVRASRAKLPAELKYDKDVISKIKKDWYGQDDIFLRDHPDSLFWNILVQAKYEKDYLDFLPPKAIIRQLNFIRDYYQREEEKRNELYNHNYPYMSTEQMDEVIDFISNACATIYDLIWIQNKSLDGLESSIALLQP